MGTNATGAKSFHKRASFILRYAVLRNSHSKCHPADLICLSTVRLQAVSMMYHFEKAHLMDIDAAKVYGNLVKTHRIYACFCLEVCVSISPPHTARNGPHTCVLQAQAYFKLEEYQKCIEVCTKITQVLPAAMPKKEFSVNNSTHSFTMFYRLRPKPLCKTQTCSLSAPRLFSSRHNATWLGTQVVTWALQKPAWSMLVS
jgi:hypothetical protein